MNERIAELRVTGRRALRPETTTPRRRQPDVGKVHEDVVGEMQRLRVLSNEAVVKQQALFHQLDSMGIIGVLNEVTSPLTISPPRREDERHLFWGELQNVSEDFDPDNQWRVIINPPFPNNEGGMDSSLRMRFINNNLGNVLISFSEDEKAGDKKLRVAGQFIEYDQSPDIREGSEGWEEAIAHAFAYPRPHETSQALQ